MVQVAGEGAPTESGRKAGCVLAVGRRQESVIESERCWLAETLEPSLQCCLCAVEVGARGGSKSRADNLT
jgi:hypothetical protein